MLMHALNYAKRIVANAHTGHVDVLLLDVCVHIYINICIFIHI